MKPLTPGNLWNHETYETMKPLTPGNLWNHETLVMRKYDLKVGVFYRAKAIQGGGVWRRIQIERRGKLHSFPYFIFVVCNIWYNTGSHICSHKAVIDIKVQ